MAKVIPVSSKELVKEPPYLCPELLNELAGEDKQHDLEKD
jgi:hypothetical protein